MSQDWKESYHNLRSQHSELQRRYHERTEELKRTNVHLSKIENLMRTKERQDSSSNGSSLSRTVKSESESVIQGLYQDKTRLDGKSKELDRKCRTLTESNEKLKRELAVAKRAARGKTYGTSSNDSRMIRSVDDSHISLTGKGADSQKLAELVSRFKLRVEEAEAELEKLRRENKQLREGNTTKSRPTYMGRDAIESMELTNEESLTKVEASERDLRDAKAELQLIKMRYEQLEVKCKATTELQKGSFDQLDEYNRRIRELRRALQDAQHDKEAAEVKGSRCEEFKERVTELHKSNQKLEDQITKLCESPFISEAYEKQDRLQRLTELEREDKSQKSVIQHLKESASLAEDRIRKLQGQLESLRSDKDHAEQSSSELKLRFRETHAGNEILQDKMRLYMGEDAGVDLEELEQALTMVKRRHAADLPENHLDFLIPIGKNPELFAKTGDDLDASVVLKRKMESMRERHLALQCECERSEKMLKVQMSINRDLHLELEELAAKQSLESKELAEKCEDYEALNLRRLHRINVLEAQLRQHRYAVNKKKKQHGGGRAPAPGGLDGDTVSECGSSSESTRGAGELLAELGNMELKPEENLIEVWLVEAELFDGVLSPSGSCFAVIDFFNFESQTTQWLQGSKPEFDFATSYKVSVDDLFLRYLATESLTIEICEAQQADYELLAKAVIPLAPLLDSRPTLVLQKCALNQVRTGRQAGFLHVEIRLALPVTELYQLFLDRHPAERHAIEKAMISTLGGPTAAGEDQRRLEDQDAALANEIEIVVHSAAGLPLNNKQPPSAYVHYQLLQYQDTFTPVQEGTREPSFEHCLGFPMASTSQALAILRTERLQFTMLDFKGDDHGEDDSLIGTVELSLAPLAEGESVYCTLPVSSETGREVGTLRVAARWRHPFKDARSTSLGPSGLTDAELRWIMSNFSPHKDGQVDYRAFIHEVDAPKSVLAAITKLRAFLERAKLSRGVKGAEQLFQDNIRNLEDMSEDEFATSLLKMHCEVPADELCALLKHRRRLSSRFGVPDLVILIEPPNNTTQTAALSKLRQHGNSLKTQGRSLSECFEAHDPERTGRLPRPTFKSALKTLGFTLVDEREAANIIPRGGPKPLETRKKNVQDDILEDEEDELMDDRDFGIRGQVAAVREEQRLFEERVRDAKRSQMEEEEEEVAEGPAPARAGGPAPARADIPLMMMMRGLDEAEPPGTLMMEQSVVSPVVRKSALTEDEESSLARVDVRSGIIGGQREEEQPPKIYKSIVAADKIVQRALRRLDEERRELPELRPAFLSVDSTGSKSVSRKQCAWTLQKFQKAFPLETQDLESLMDHFACSSSSSDDKKNSSPKVDYPSLIKFFEFRPSKPSPAARFAQRMALHEGHRRLLEEADVQRTGCLPPDVLSRLFAQQGYRCDAEELNGLTRLFPPSQRVLARHDGAAGAQIDHAAFFDYAREQEASVSLRKAENKLRDVVQSMLEKDPSEEDTLRSMFVPNGKLNRAQAQRLIERLIGQGQNLDSLLSRLDPRGEGLTCDALLLAMQNGVPLPVSRVLEAAAADWAQLRARCKSTMLELTERLGAGLAKKQLEVEFAHFDWRGAHILPVDSFAVAALRAGFLLSKAELRLLGERFVQGDSAGVAYGRFLGWATAADATNKGDAPSVLLKIAKKIIALSGKKRKPALKSRWWREVFEDMDRDRSKQLSMRDMAAAFEELGVAEDLTDEEIEMVCDRFKKQQRHVDYPAFLKALDDAVAHSTTAPAKKTGGVALDLDRLGTNDATAAVRDALRECVREGVDFRALFEAEDPEFSGVLAKGGQALERVLNSLRVDISHGEQLASRFGASAQGGLHYVEMLNTLLPPRGTTGGNIEAWRSEERLRAMIRRRFEWKLPGRLRRAFRHFDSRRKGHVTEPELADGLRALKLKLSAEQDRLLFEVMDLDGDGLLDYPEFLVFVKDPNHYFVEQKVKYAVASTSLSASSARRTLEEFDTNNSGLLGLEDFGRALQRLGIDLSKSEQSRLSLRFDLNEDGNISIDRFFAFLKGDPEGGKGASSSGANALRSLKSTIDRDMKQRNKGKKPFDLERRLMEHARDPRFSGSLEKSEIARAMESLGAELSSADLALLTARFDKHGDGRVGLRDLVHFLDEEDEPSSDKNRVDSVLKREMDRLGLSSKVLKEAFLDLDSRESGRVSRRDFRRELERIGLDVNSAELDDFYARFATGDDVDYTEFVRECKSKMEPKGIIMLRAELKRLARQSGAPDYARVFRKIDRDDSGRIDRRELRRALEALGFDSERLTSEDLDSVVERFDKDGDGSISIVEFVKFCEGDDDRALLDLVTREIKRLSKGKTSAESLSRAFREFDRNDSGYISKKEFAKELERLGFDFTRAELEDVLMKKLDKDGDGKIAFKEFITLARRDVTGGDEDAVGRLKPILKQAAEDGTRLGDIFRDYDREDSGDCDEIEFERALKKKLGVELSPSELSGIAKKFAGRRGCIRYRDFLKAFDGDDEEPSGLRALRSEIKRLAKRAGDYERVFEEFDRDGRGELSRRDFGRFLERVGFELREKDLASVFSRFDKNHDGVVSIREFVKFASTSDGKEASTIACVRREISRLQRRGRLSLREASFEDFDRDGSGFVTRREFRKELEKMGFELTTTELEAVFTRFANRNNDGTVGYKEFIKLFASDFEEEDDHPIIIIEKLREEVNGREDDLASVLEKLDVDGEGELDEEDLERGLKKIDVRLSRRDVEHVAKEYGRRGRIDYPKLLKALKKQHGGSPRRSSRSRSPRSKRTASSSKEEPEGIVALRSELRRMMAKNSEEDLDFQRLFRKFDRDDSGYLDRKEFRRALESKMGFEAISSSELTQVIEFFDKSGDGRVSVREFCAFAEEPSDDDVMDKLKKAVKRAVEDDGVSVRDCFEHFDRDGSGDLDEREFEKGLAKLGITPSSRDLAKLVEKFGRRGRVKYKDFARAVSSRSSSPRAKSSHSPRPRSSSPRAGDDEEALASLKAELKRVAKRHKPDYVESALRDHLEDRLDKRGLRKALEAMDIEIKSSTIAVLVRHFESLRELIKFSKTSSDDIIETLRTMVRDAEKEGITVHECFEHFDRDGSGDLDEDEFKRGLKKLGIRLSSREVAKLLSQFPSRRAGRIKYKDFAKAVAGSSSRNSSPRKSKTRDYY